MDANQPLDPSPSRRPSRSLSRRILRLALRVVLAMAVFVALYFGAAEVLARITVNDDADPLAGDIDVYFVTNGVHVDVWVPARNVVKDWQTWLPREVPVDEYGYVAFGWGERNFYMNVPTWDDLTAGIAANAIFVPSSTAMHVSALYGRPREGDHVHLFGVSAEAYRRLCEYIEAGFALDDANRPQLIDHPGYGQNDRFFVGSGSYHMFRSCNVWTGGAVAALGQQTGLWTPLEHHVRLHLPKNRGQR
jgi:uncharacterized protein (TIGR02117 family)